MEPNRVSRPSQAYNWCCTLNNYTQIQYHTLIYYFIQDCKYFIIAKEKVSTPHLQIYIQLKTKKRFNQIKEYCLNMHVESAKGSKKQNIIYCKKENDYYEYPVQESTSRLEASKDFIKHFKDNTIYKWTEKYPQYMLFNGKDIYENYFYFQSPIDRPTINVMWIYGPPGTGKTRYAHNILTQAYIKDPRTKWWHGYALQTQVIIDDFARDGIDITRLLAWFDRYKCTVETKGGQMPLYATKFILTSNFTPEQVYPDHPQLPALLRRIHLIDWNVSSTLLCQTTIMNN